MKTNLLPAIEVGKRYRFDTKKVDSKWMAFDGQNCTIIRPLTREEADIDDIGPMWRVRFDDEEHTETDAFDNELYGSFREKIVLISSSAAATLIADLPYGEPTDAGDRTSRYVDIATSMGRESFVKAALIEEKTGISKDKWGYSLHVLNDVDGTDGFFLTTEHLSEEELAELLDDLAYNLCLGRL